MRETATRPPGGTVDRQATVRAICSKAMPMERQTPVVLKDIVALILYDVFVYRKMCMSEEQIYREIMDWLCEGLRPAEGLSCKAFRYETRVAFWQRAVLAALAVTEDDGD
jgi:hypothetical protein